MSMALPSTSLAAYRSIKGGLSTVHSALSDLLESAGEHGLILDELVARSGYGIQTVSARIPELEELGLAVRLGDTRTGGSGRQQKVVRSTSFAKASAPVVKGGMRKTGFLAGLMHAAELVAASPSLEEARQAMRSELLKAARKASGAAKT